MILGCAWYPEHWPEERWPEDLRLMREAGMTVVRVAEFAWSRMEPAEGQFQLDWLERAIALAAEQGITTVLGTPSAAPPAWLTQQYPETLAVRENGQRATHGNRCHYSPASAKYRELSRRIAEEMATRFGANPSVVGWQIDNEYNSASYDAETQRQFQSWLQGKYGTLESLNTHWTTAYWSQEYTDWAQLPLPIDGHNPSLRLDWRHFITHLYRTFQKEQIDVIRAHAEPRQWITHNFMGWFDLFDHYEVSADLDIASWDNYVGSGHLDYLSNGAGHDLARGFKRKNFLLLETQPGNVNWSTINNVLDKGEVRCMAWHAIGHGADLVSYWQWRSALGGQEQYHGSLIAPDGTPRPLYEEVAKLGKELSVVGKLLKDTTPEAPIALLHSYDDDWAINFQRLHTDFDPVAHLQSFYRPLRAQTFDIDIVQPTAPLDGYRLAIAPHLHLIDDALAVHLLAYVQGGGHLVLGPRSGMKDPYNALLSQRQPGPLTQALGAHVEEYYALEGPIAVNGNWGEGEAKIWAEWLTVDADDVQVLQRYRPCNGWLDDQPAMVTRKFGEGRLTYIGAWFEEEFMAKTVAWLVRASRLEPVFSAIPEGVEVCRRGNPGKEVFVLVNHTAKPQQITLPMPLYNLLNRQLLDKTVWIPARDVFMLGRGTK